jgi:hypothetical protein
VLEHADPLGNPERTEVTMLYPNEVTAARLLHGANDVAARIVSAKIRNALQPILLCADSVSDAEALAGVGDLTEIADYLHGPP